MNWHSLFFYIYAALACGFALGVVFARNVVRMAFYLIYLWFSIGSVLFGRC